MKEFIIDTVFGLTQKTENKISKIVAKILYYFNCAVIAIWLSEICGLGFTYESISYDAVLKFVFSLTVLIPVLTFLFALQFSRIIVVLIVNSFAELFKKPIHRRFFKSIEPKAFLISQQVITSDSKRGTYFDHYLIEIKKSRKELKGTKFWIEYTCDFSVTLVFIYNVIVTSKFPELFYKWINITLILYTFAVLMAYVILIRAIAINKKIVKVMMQALAVE